MAHEINLVSTVSKVKDSLDYLQNSILDDQHSRESLLRLSKALKDIDEEVNLLRTVMQIGNHRDYN